MSMEIQTSEKSKRDRILTIEDVSSLLKIAKRTVWRLVSTGKLPQPIRYGRNVRWRSSDIERWIEQGCPEIASRQGQKGGST